MAPTVIQYSNRESLAADRFRGEGVELGVAKGRFSQVILQNCHCRRLGSIDRWADHHDAAEYVEAARMLASAGLGRCILLRMTFEEALPFYPDDSLDFVYVDGYAHAGQEGGKTIEQWWKKVKPGGTFAGHDYHPKWVATMNAVDAFVERHGLVLNLTLSADEPGAGQYPSWWVEKPATAQNSNGGDFSAETICGLLTCRACFP